MAHNPLPCPYCQSETRIWKDPYVVMWQVVCRSPMCFSGPWKGSTEEATIAWNKVAGLAQKKKDKGTVTSYKAFDVFREFLHGKKSLDDFRKVDKTTEEEEIK